MILTSSTGNVIQPIQDTSKFQWAGVPYRDRYSKTSKAEDSLLKRIWEIDELLDLKIYLPTMKWHLVRYPHGRLRGDLVRVWELVDDPELGLRAQPGEWMIIALKRGDTRGRDIEAELDAMAEVREKKAADKLADDSMEFAKEVAKPIKALLDYGPNHEYKGVF